MEVGELHPFQLCTGTAHGKQKSSAQHDHLYPGCNRTDRVRDRISPDRFRARRLGLPGYPLDHSFFTYSVVHGVAIAAVCAAGRRTGRSLGPSQGHDRGGQRRCSLHGVADGSDPYRAVGNLAHLRHHGVQFPFPRAAGTGVYGLGQFAGAQGTARACQRHHAVGNHFQLFALPYSGRLAAGPNRHRQRDGH